MQRIVLNGHGPRIRVGLKNGSDAKMTVVTNSGVKTVKINGHSELRFAA